MQRNIKAYENQARVNVEAFSPAGFQTVNSGGFAVAHVDLHSALHLPSRSAQTLYLLTSYTTEGCRCDKKMIDSD